MRFEAIAVENIPLIKKGADLPAQICKNIELQNKDIVVLASTIVAKAEGLTFQPEALTPSPKALEIAARNQHDPCFVEAVLSQSKELLVETPFMLAVTKKGHTCVNAGIDNSNVEGELLLNTPEDPDASAAKIGKRLEGLTGKKLSVIITDTNGRAFKLGQTGVAIGVYKIHPLKRWIGEKDLFGRTLEVSVEAVADELAGAANLLMGEAAGGLPVVLLRGLDYYAEEASTIKEMYRAEPEDLIKKGLRKLLKEKTNPKNI
ncbi:MAG: coenzyme F420-0:L-glutamate ligase [Methanosarcinaceae archaeon]|nr:coenzyme F420-0:L-glutamate ligase [Methanosarcinaceae archaeon]